MIHSEQPRHENHVTLMLTFVCMLGGIVLFAASMYMPAFPAVVQALAVALLVAGIALVGLHQTRYIYRIEPDSRGGEGFDLVVVQIKSRRETVVCRLGLSDVRRIDRQTPENRDALKRQYAGQGLTVHRYCVDLLPASSQYISFDDGGEQVVIRLQASETLLCLLEEHLPDRSRDG